MDPEHTLPAPDSRLSRLSALAGNRSIRERFVVPIGFDALTLLVNLVTGVLVARLLGTSGRGELAAILAFAQMAGWIFSLGASQAASYHQARRPEDGPVLVGSWLSLLIPSGVAAVLAGELLLPVFFAAQTDQALSYAQLYLAIVVAYVLQELMLGVLAGDHDFLSFNATRLAQPTLIALGYVVIWQAGDLSVSSALIVNAAATGVMTVAVTARAIARVGGLSMPRATVLRPTLSYALRSHLGNVGGFMTARLDLIIVPAFLAASSVGLYSVAVNVSSIIPTLTGTLAFFVLPAAARAGGASARTVVRSLHVTIAVSLVVAGVIFVLAEVALRLVYGSDFVGSTDPLRILLPGVVFDAAAAVVWSGILASGHPLLGAVTAGAGLTVTIVGLVLVLPDGGVEGAALVSTLSYLAMMLMAMAVYRQVALDGWRQFLRAPAADPG